MKRLVFANLLLNLYLLAIVQPALPIIEYMLRYDYIVNELCENRDKPILACIGKCYLGEKVEQQLELEHHGKERVLPPKMELEKQVVTQPETFHYEFTNEDLHMQNPVFHSTLADKDFLFLLFRPPIA